MPGDLDSERPELAEPLAYGPGGAALRLHDPETGDMDLQRAAREAAHTGGLETLDRMAEVLGGQPTDPPS